MNHLMKGYLLALLGAVGLVGALVVPPAPAGAAGAGAASAHARRASTHVKPVATGGVSVTGTISGVAGQKIDGFGVSGAWWPADLAQFPASVQDEVQKMLFSPSGLEVSQYRYLIGSGGVGIVPSHRFKIAPSYLTAKGYNWKADPAGQMFLQYAAAAGVPDLVAFANAPPAVLNPNHKSCGIVLQDPEVGPYAKFLTTVLNHLINVEDIPINYVAPMNEPSDPHPECWQEGSEVHGKVQAVLIRTLHADLAAADLPVGIVADDAVTTTNLLLDMYYWNAQTRADVAVLSDHNYDFPGEQALDRVAALDQPHWASEICCYHAGRGFSPGYDPTMTSGLWLAETIYQDLVEGGYSGFDWWLAASPDLGCDPVLTGSCARTPNTTGSDDGLIYYDPSYATDHNYGLYVTKRFWVMASFSRYVRPGAVLHRVDGLSHGIEAVSFSSGNTLTTVIINTNDRPGIVHLAAPTGTTWSGKATAVQTDTAESAQPVRVSTAAGALVVPAPAGSVTTVVSPTRDPRAKRKQPGAGA